MNDTLRDAVIAAWQRARVELAIEVHTPYRFQGSQREHECIAFLPEYGGPHGMLVQTTQPPAFAVDEGLQADAKAPGLYLSFINAEVYCTFERDRFQELLTDWGYFGAIERRPAWREL